MGLPKRVEEFPVGHDEPRPPTRSLPSYKEPTPETHRKLTREDEAEIALKRTIFTPGTRLSLITLFLITIAIVPIVQLVAEMRAGHQGRWLPMFETFRVLIPTKRGFPKAEEIKSAEKRLETDSVVSQWLLPPVQSILTGRLGVGNEQVYLGRDGWLFYRADVDYVTGPGFLNPTRMRQRAHAAAVQPDPVKAIVHFRDQLTARGIDLIIVPVPTKATVEADKLGTRAPATAELQNASLAEFKARIAAAGVRMFDPAPVLMQRKATGAPLYLKTDTHWRPETMQFVAQEFAKFRQLDESSSEFNLVEQEISGVGDLARMLKLPALSSEPVVLRQITSGNNLWRPRRDGEVLLLGDSFANIFSLKALGWGESAGFAEHLSHWLGGRAIDCILRNSDGAFATREMLAHELARGNDRLAGKHLVIWEFAARELAFGDWKLIDLKLGARAPARFFAPKPGETLEVTGTVEAASSVPQAGTTPYADHIMSVHVAEIRIAGGPLKEEWHGLVYLQSMRDHVWTEAARLRPGDQVRLRLRAWSDVAPQLESINRSELDNPELQLEEPAWGELLK